MSFQQSFNQFIIDHKVIGFFDQPITLKSGRKSNWYVNWRTLSEDVFLMDRLTDFVIDFTCEKDLHPDCFFGVAEGATKLGILTQFKWAKASEKFDVGQFSLSMGRAKPKMHGDSKDMFFVGLPKGKTIILEDTTTTGLSTLECIETLKKAGVDIIAVINLTNRMEKRDDGKSVDQVIEETGIPFFMMSKATDLLPLAILQKDPGVDIKMAIETEFRQFGLQPIIL